MKVYKFSAEWCQPCHTMAPIFENISNNPMFSDVEFIEIDIDTTDQYNLMTEWKIKNIPTFVVADDNNKLIKRVSGSMPEEFLTNFIKEAIDLCQNQ